MTIAPSIPGPSFDSPASATAVIRPLISTLTKRYALSAACIIVPPMITLYAFTVPSGTWGYILVIHATMVAIAMFLSRSLGRAKVVFTDDGFTETDLFTAPVHTRREDLRSILLIPVTDGNSVDTFDHLFLLDGQDRVRLRMRGRFWGREALRTVVAAYELPVTRVAETKTLADLRNDYARYLFWRERHPRLLAIFMALGIVVVFGPVMWFVNTLI